MRRALLMKVLVGGAALLALVGGTGFLFMDHPYTVTAYFLSAEGLVPGNDVVVGGMPAGTIQDVRIGSENQSQGGAVIVMQLNERFAPLHRGTHATIQQKGLLGNMFINLQLGPSVNASIPSGGVLPIQDTSTPVDLDQIQDIFDKTTRQKIQTMTRQGGVALDQRGTDVNKLLGQLPAISANAADITANLDSRYDALDANTVEFDRIAYMMASEDQAFRRDLENGASILDTLAAHSARLQDELTYGNRALTLLNAALVGHEGDLNQLLKEMPGLLDQTKSFSDTNSTALAILDPCVGDIITAIAEMRDAQKYPHNVNSNGDGGAKDGQGLMLRVNATPAQANASTGQLRPSVACSGGRP